MTGAFALRVADTDDVPAIHAIYADHVAHGTATFELETPTLDEMRARHARVLDGGHPYLVACDPAGGVLGYAYAAAFRPRPAYRFTVEDSIYLKAGATGRGIGRALLERLIDDCTVRGFRQMVAVIGDSANAASIALHRTCGFAHFALFPATGLKFGRWIDTVMMQRALGEGAASVPAGEPAAAPTAAGLPPS